MKRKKSTGGLFLGADQLNKDVFPFIRESGADVGALAVLGTEWIFFGRPTEKRAERREEL